MVCTEKKSGSAALERIKLRGKLVIATPGDYCPMAFHSELSGGYRGFDIEMAWLLAARLGVKAEFVQSSWSFLEEDALASHFDLAVGGISRTAERAEDLTLSDGYLPVGKTILCRKEDAARFKSFADVDRPDVCVMYNDGGTNELFVGSHLKQAKLRHCVENEMIPLRIIAGEADVMLTETIEAAFYTRKYSQLAAPLIKSPFNKGEFCIVFGAKAAPLAPKVNEILQKFRTDGTLDHLCQTYLGVAGLSDL